jgi:hypothetical protein
MPVWLVLLNLLRPGSLYQTNRQSPTDETAKQLDEFGKCFDHRLDRRSVAVMLDTFI